MAARRAEKLGYTNIKVYHDGIPAWSEAGNVLYTDGAFVEQMMGFLVLLDLRGVEAAKKSHIQGAVALEMKNLEKEKSQFPTDRKAPIILYTDKSDWKELQPAVKLISSWGYSRIRVLEGGFEGWLAKNRPTQKGDVRTTIFYIPRPHPGEISGDEFMNIVKTHPADKVILDVRNKDEAAEGILEGAVQIPLDALQGRLNELPKDKEIILHCRTGLRAEMGYHILRNAGGYKARFLNDKIAIKGKDLFCCYK
jgi:rhodanese-related sulfurtransferase